MKPYLEFIKAVMQDHDPSPELEAIRQLPLEKRYVWRVASALKWGPADCESLSVQADKQTLTPADFAQVMQLLKFRPMQLALVLKVLLGAEPSRHAKFLSVMASPRGQSASEGTPLGRCGIPDDVAEVIVFLASNQAHGLTGQLLYLGGGWRMHL